MIFTLSHNHPLPSLCAKTANTNKDGRNAYFIGWYISYRP